MTSTNLDDRPGWRKRLAALKKLAMLGSGLVSLSGCVSVPAVKDTSRTFHTVVIDAGHGGYDSGVAKRGVVEKEATLDVSKRIETKLRCAGFRTVMTRTRDVYVPLETRAGISNNQTNAVFVSIHFNDTRKRRISGVETYYNSDGAEQLAARIQAGLSGLSSNRGVKHANYRVLRLNKFPAVLVECGFLSNGFEARKCKTSAYREELATRISRALIAQRGGGVVRSSGW